MLQISLEGQSELSERLAILPDDLRAALAEKMNALAQEIFTQIVDVNLSGGVLNAHTGALRDSVKLREDNQDSAFTVEIATDGSAPYDAIQEYGGKTAAHEIIPDKARALAFMFNGKQFFARRVQHPGSLIPERSYLRSALEERSEDIRQALSGALAGALQRATENAAPGAKENP
jgi:phage gpG-like protein